MTVQTQTQSIETNAEPDVVFEILVDPRNIPGWAPAFADRVIGDEQQGWTAVKDDKPFSIRVVSSPSSRTVDYLRAGGLGRDAGAYLRVFPGPVSGSVLVMTLPLSPSSSAASVAATLRQELECLVQIAESKRES